MTVLVETFRALMRRNARLPAEVLWAAHAASLTTPSATNESAFWSCREELARRDDCPPDLLLALTRDERASVRHRALLHPQLPAGVLHAACRRETDRDVLNHLAAQLTDPVAVDLLACRRLGLTRYRASVDIRLAENIATLDPATVDVPSLQAAASLVLRRLDALLPVDTTSVEDFDAKKVPLHKVDDAVATLIAHCPAAAAAVVGELRSLRARVGVLVSGAELPEGVCADLVAELVLVPLAAAPEPQLPRDIAHLAANFLDRAALPTAVRQLVVAAVSRREWHRNDYSRQLQPHLDPDTAAVEAAARDEQLAAQVTSCRDAGELAGIAGRPNLAKVVARALVANPTTPSPVAARVAAAHLQFGDDVDFACAARGHDEEFLLGYARGCLSVLPRLPQPGAVTRMLLEEHAEDGLYRAAEFARNTYRGTDSRLTLLTEADRMALRWRTARAVAGQDEAYDAWLLEILLPVLERPGGGALLVRADAEFTGTVAELLTLLSVTLAEPGEVPAVRGFQRAA